MQTERARKNKKILWWSLIIVIAMFGFAFALVPLYNVLCKVTGLNGKTNGTSVLAATASKIDKTRWITVEFVATNNATLPWKFYPLQTKIRIHPGQMTRVAYFAENLSNHTMTIQAIPSVAPGIAAEYLKKTECFCFTAQTLKAKQKVNMPILFHLDTALPKNIHTVTLSYTLFDRTKDKT